jgi:flagellar motor switch protein FliM
MSELKVLSKEEVDVLLNLSRESIAEITEMANHSGVHQESWTGKVNLDVLKNITELTVAECEQIFTSFLRKKILVKYKDTIHAKLSECLTDKVKNHIFSVFHVTPNDRFGMVAMDMVLLHQTINLLYGGVTNKEEPIIEQPGKIGLLIAEKIAQINLDGFKKACNEYGEINCKVIKTMNLPSLTSKLNPEEVVYGINMTVQFEEVESEFMIFLTETFLEGFIPQAPKEINYVENNLWRAAIEKQMIDSMVSINITLPDINIKANDLFSLKNGDLIPMTDPTAVYVCLNNLKLFRAKAGQANSKRVVKIVQEI